MHVYKVDFKNNIPEKATMVAKTYYKELTKIDRHGNRTVLRWLYVHADDESEAIKNANNFKDAILNKIKYS